METICAERYKDRKSRFKHEWFADREGFEHPGEISQFPPPNIADGEWDKFEDYVVGEANKGSSVVNTENKSKQQYPSLHGTRFYADIRHANVSSFIIVII